MPRPVTLKVDSNRLDPAGEASPYDEVMAEAERCRGVLPRYRLGEKGDRYNIAAEILYLSPFSSNGPRPLRHTFTASLHKKGAARWQRPEYSMETI